MREARTARNLANDDRIRAVFLVGTAIVATIFGALALVSAWFW